MKRKWWRVVLWAAFVLMVFCAVRDVRRPTASRGAQRIEVRAGRAPSDEKEADAQFQKAAESIDESDAKAANESRLRQQEGLPDREQVILARPAAPLRVGD
jgi:flagellar biosynthesis/type III secretory pathway M-ring protein FliF/YscJ